MLKDNASLYGNQNVSGPNASLESTVDPTAIFGPRRDTLLLVIPTTVVYVVIFITGLVGNIFVFIEMKTKKTMNTATKYYLMSLAVSDLLLLVSGMPQEIYYIWCKWPYLFGAEFCILHKLAAETTTNASILTITLFMIERFIAVCHPFKSHKMSKLSRAKKHVIIIWIAAFALALPQALQFGIQSHKGVDLCLQTRVIIEHSFVISTFVFFLAPMVINSVLCLLIGLRLHNTSKAFSRNMRKMNKRHGQFTRRVVMMLGGVVLAFFICWAPFHAQRLIAIYGITEIDLARSSNLLFFNSILTYISKLLMYLSTCINLILYHSMSNKFWDALKATTRNDRKFGKVFKMRQRPMLPPQMGLKL